MPTNIHTIILKPGERFSLPDGAEIIFTSNSDGLDSDCAVIPETAYKCGYFQMVLDRDNNTGHSGDETNTKYASLRVGSTTYNLDIKVIASGSDPGTVTNEVGLNALIPDQYLFTFTSVTQDTLTKKQVINAYFKMSDQLFDDTELKIDNGGTPYYVKPLGSHCT